MKTLNKELFEAFSVKIEKEVLIDLIKNNDKYYHYTAQIALSEHEPQNWRSVWILQHCTAKNDKRFQEYINDFIKIIPKRNHSFQREGLKVIAKMNLDEEQEGRLFDICMQLWENINGASAVRFFSFKMIHRTVEKYPELKGELKFLSQDQYLENLSPGIKKIIQKVISEN